MDVDQQKIEGMRAEVISKQKRREAISQAALEGNKTADEVRSLFAEGSRLDQEIEELESAIRDLEFPGVRTERGTNPWE